MVKEKKEYTVPPKEYAAYVKGINIKEIKFENGSFKFTNSELVDSKSKLKPKFKKGKPELKEIHDDYFVVHHKLGFSVVEVSSRKLVIDVKCCIVVVYNHADGITKEMFEPFGDFNVPVNTWPYFREFVNSATTRLGLPPFTLPAWIR